MRSNRFFLFAVAVCATACSSAPASTPDAPRACATLNGNVTFADLTAQAGNTCPVPNTFAGDTWTLWFDGQGKTTLYSQLFVNGTAGSGGAWSCTGGLKTETSISLAECSTIVVQCPVASGHIVSVVSRVDGGLSAIGEGEADSACVNLYLASATH
jgi:hypothetical protein